MEERLKLLKAQEAVDTLNVMKGNITDGSHSFDELYYHRMILFSVILNKNREKAWKSKKHADGTMYDDCFIVGVDTSMGQFSYHYHLDNWALFSNIKELRRAPKWDGHTSNDVIRLLSL